MKFNKWTVALAAVGVVSLASAAKAEEKTSSVLTALSSTTISGYVDTSMEWNFGTGNANVPPYKFNSPSKSDGFNLNVVQIRIEKPLDEQEWSAGYRVDLWAGPDANTLRTQSTLGNGSTASTSDFAVRQAYVVLRTPVGNGLDWKVGVFDSIIGYESVEAGNNPNYTRSYGHSIEPQTHTGVLASYRFCDVFSASVGVADTIGPSINSRAQIEPSGNAYAESYKTYMGSVALTAPDSMGFLSGSTLYGGAVNGYNNSANSSVTGVAGTAGMPQRSFYVGSTIATPVTGLRFGIAWDYLDFQTQYATGTGNLHVDGTAWAVAGYLSYQATEKLSFHARCEYYDQTTESPTGSHTDILALTGTVQYDLWKNVISRLELRWDHSLNDQDIFGGTTAGSPTVGNAVMLAGNIIYKF